MLQGVIFCDRVVVRIGRKRLLDLRVKIVERRDRGHSYLDLPFRIFLTRMLNFRNKEIMGFVSSQNTISLTVQINFLFA